MSTLKTYLKNVKSDFDFEKNVIFLSLKYIIEQISPTRNIYFTALVSFLF